MFTREMHSLPLSWASKKSFIFSFIQIFGASLFIWLCAQVKIPLFFTPVPISAHTFAIILTGAMLGSRKGVLSVLLYLLEGTSFGILNPLGLYGGYYLGFVAQAYLVGWFLERMAHFDSRKIMAVILFSCVIQMGLGALWLVNYVGMDQALMLGFYPFVPGEVIKALAVTTFLKTRCKKS